MTRVTYENISSVLGCIGIEFKIDGEVKAWWQGVGAEAKSSHLHL